MIEGAATAELKKGPGWAIIQARLDKYAKDGIQELWENDARQIPANHLKYAKMLCPVSGSFLRRLLGTTLRDSLYITSDQASAEGFESGDKTAKNGALSIKSNSFGSGQSDFFQGPHRWYYYLTSSSPIARYVEYGTQHMAARPFMRPALAFAKAMYRARLKILADNVRASMHVHTSGSGFIGIGTRGVRDDL